MLPVNKKINRDKKSQMKIWIYGEPTIGKTIFANSFKNVLFLNTDGNVKYIDSPVVPIVGGTNKDGWEVFLETIESLISEKHSYETIVVDLVDDVYQYCRQHFNKKLKIDHEGELPFAKGYDIIRNSFLVALRTLANSGLNVIFVSHEKVTTFKDRIGRESTRFQPSLPDKVASKISGMVDITGRVTINSTESEDGTVNDSRILYLDATKDQVGGNRIPTISKEFIPLEYEELLKVYGGEK